MKMSNWVACWARYRYHSAPLASHSTAWRTRKCIRMAARIAPHGRSDGRTDRGSQTGPPPEHSGGAPTTERAERQPFTQTTCLSLATTSIGRPSRPAPRTICSSTSSAWSRTTTRSPTTAAPMRCTPPKRLPQQYERLPKTHAPRRLAPWGHPGTTACTSALGECSTGPTATPSRSMYSMPVAAPDITSWRRCQRRMPRWFA